MNVYDEAHTLAKAIKDSNEFKQFDIIRAEVDKDEQLTQMLKDLQTIQLEMQAAQMTGKEMSPELLTRMQSLSAMIATKPMASQYLQAQAAFTVMMNDVFGIIGEAVGLK